MLLRQECDCPGCVIQSPITISEGPDRGFKFFCCLDCCWFRYVDCDKNIEDALLEAPRIHSCLTDHPERKHNASTAIIAEEFERVERVKRLVESCKQQLEQAQQMLVDPHTSEQTVCVLRTNTIGPLWSTLADLERQRPKLSKLLCRIIEETIDRQQVKPPEIIHVSTLKRQKKI